MIKISLFGLALAGVVSAQALAADAPKAVDAKAVESKAVEKKAADTKGADKKGAESSSPCTFEVDATDTMKYVEKGSTTTDLKEIKIPESCRSKDIVFKLKHIGTLPANVMGHNLVIVESSKQDAVVAAGMKAGAAAGYLPAKADGMIAHTSTIGGGQSAEVKLAKGTLKAGTNYGFVCTFAGHAGIMKGTLTFVK